MLGLLTLLLVTLQQAPLAAEPGHPQETIVPLLVALPLAAATWGGRAPGTAALVLGLLVGALAMTKVNVGVLALVGVSIALLSSAATTPPIILLRLLSVLAAAALPWVLMSGFLDIVTTRLAVVTSVAVVTLAAVTYRKRERGVGLLREGGLFVVGAGIAIAGLGSFAIARRSTWSAMVTVLAVQSRQLVRMRFAMLVLPSVSTAAIYSVIAALGWSAARQWGPARLHRVLLATLQLAIAALAWASVEDARGMLRIVPWVWLAAVADVEDPGRMLWRLVLTWLAVLQPLEIFPVGGSQFACGSLLPFLCILVALGDGLTVLSAAVPAPYERRVAAVLGTLLLAGALFTGTMAVRAAEARFEGSVPLDLPGAEHVRLESRSDAEAIQALVREIRTRCHSLLTLPGFQSLHFWTGVRPVLGELIPNRMRLVTDDTLKQLGYLVAAQPGVCLERGPTLDPLSDRRLDTMTMRSARSVRLRFGPYVLLAPDRPRSTVAAGGDRW